MDLAMHPISCRKCKEKNKFEFGFKISKIDVIGFLFLSLLLTGPVWAFTYVWESIPDKAEFVFLFICLIISSYTLQILISFLFLSLLLIFPIEIVEIGIEYLFLLYSVDIRDEVAALAFAMMFYKIGCRVYGFFFLCVNYKFKFKVFCNSCGNVFKNVNLPTKSDLNIGI